MDCNSCGDKVSHIFGKDSDREGCCNHCFTCPTCGESFPDSFGGTDSLDCDPYSARKFLGNSPLCVCIYRCIRSPSM